MWHASPHLRLTSHLKVKLRLHEAAVCSLLTYSHMDVKHGTLALDTTTTRRINGANSAIVRCLQESGNLLMDAPPHDSIDDLRSIVNDREKWRALVRHLHWLSLVCIVGHLSVYTIVRPVQCHGSNSMARNESLKERELCTKKISSYVVT